MRRLMVATVIIAVYFAGYRALVVRNLYQESGSRPDQARESYRYAPRLCTVVFAPANRLHRMLCPRDWDRPACVW